MNNLFSVFPGKKNNMPVKHLLLIADEKEVYEDIEDQLSHSEYSFIHRKKDEDDIKTLLKFEKIEVLLIELSALHLIQPEDASAYNTTVIVIFSEDTQTLPAGWQKHIPAQLFTPLRKGELSAALKLAENNKKHGRSNEENSIFYKKLQHELEHSRNRFITFMEYLPGAVFIKNSKSQYVFANKHMREKSGEHDLIGKTPYDIFNNEDALKDVEEDRIALEQKGYEGVAKGRDKKENPGYYRILKFPIPGEDGASLIGGMALDITSLISAQQDLKLNEERLRLAVEAANAGTWDRNFESNKIYLSPFLRQIFGLEGQNSIDVNYFWKQIVFPDDRERVYKVIEDHIQGRSIGYEVEYRIRKSNGKISWLQERGSIPERDDKGNPLRLTGVIIDISTRKDMEEAIKEREELLKALIESLPDLAFVIDEDGKYIKVFAGNNQTVANSTQRINKSLHDILPAAQADEALEIVRQTIETGISQRFEYYIHIDGEDLWYEGVTSLMSFTKDGKKLVAWIARDMTAHKKLEEKSLEARRMAENANRAKSEFLANMSHEIRTPMNNIIGMTDLAIETTELDEEQQEYLEIIRSSSDHLLKIINDILNLSKIEAGKVQFEKNPFHLGETLEEIIYAVKPVADKKNLKIEFNIDENIPDQLVGDEVHLKQILYNLVGNAVKFTDEGGCLVTIRRNKKQDDKADNICLRFSVEDTGIGIRENMQENIFEAFSQAHHFTGIKPEGTGLGLSITKKIVEKLGGTIWFSSEENVGSAFSFILPFDLYVENAKNEDVAIENKQEERQTTGADSLKLLVAEDNDLNQKLILRLLGNRGHKIVIVENGVRAVEKLRQESFDAIFMDIQMPELDGVDATRLIRKDKSGDFDPDIPIVAVTAYAFEEDKYKFFEAGMNEFIPKPINSRRLDEVLQKLKNMKEEKSDLSSA